MTEDLSQAHEIILIVSQELMGHRVSQQMRKDLESTDLCKPVAQTPNATIRQCPTLTYEHVRRGNRRYMECHRIPLRMSFFPAPLLTNSFESSLEAGEWGT